MSMVASRQVDFRKNQKDRTRAAIVDGAMSLLRSGVTPTVISAAEEARVSRATAYRYFPTQDALINEVMTITPAIDHVEQIVHNLTSADPHERLARVLDSLNRTMLAREGEGRAAMRLYLELWFASKKKDPDSLPMVRAGRRRRWLEEVLAPVDNKLTPTARRRLINSLSLTMSIDSLVIMKDVCGLDDEEALEVLQWTAGIILDAGLREAEQVKARRLRGRTGGNSSSP